MNTPCMLARLPFCSAHKWKRKLAGCCRRLNGRCRAERILKEQCFSDILKSLYCFFSFQSYCRAWWSLCTSEESCYTPDIPTSNHHRSVCSCCRAVQDKTHMHTVYTCTPYLSKHKIILFPLPPLKPWRPALISALSGGRKSKNSRERGQRRNW